MASRAAYNVAVDLANAVQRQWGRDSYMTPQRNLAEEAFAAHGMVKKAVGFFIRSGF